MRLVDDDWRTLFGISTHDIGTVVSVDDADRYDIGVAWDRDLGGHDLYGNCADGHGLWVAGYALELVLHDELLDEQFEPVTEDELFRALLEK